MTTPSLPTHVIVAPSLWAASWFARKHKLDPDCWIHVASLSIAQEQMARANDLGVPFAPIIVTPAVSIPDDAAADARREAEAA